MTIRNATRRVALVTGASRGLGAEIAGLLAGQSYDLVLTARGREALEDSAARLARYGTRIVAIAGDIREREHRQRLVNAARDLGGLHLLVNNASDLGVSPLPALVDYPLDALADVFSVNVLAPLGLIQEAIPLLKTRMGLVVNISSDAATGGYEGWGGYGASKAALDLISKTLANELRTEGVAVVSVDPGDMRTAMHQQAYPEADISDRPQPDVTLPFWSWLLNREPAAISGQRFQAQGTIWEAHDEAV